MHYFFKTLLEHPEFDIMKVYMNGALVDLCDPVTLATEESPTVPSTVAIDPAKEL